MTASAESSAVARTPVSGVPAFFIVGQPKCGTTALYEMLRRHPGLHMPVKEPWYFAADRLPVNSEGYPKTLDEYLSLFGEAPPGKLVGEASPVYLMSEVAASAIAEVRPDARIIAILREPAEFLRSLHLQSVQDHVETEKDLGRAIALEPARREGREIPRHTDRPHELMYSEHVRYVEQLKRFDAVFPPEQVLVLIYDDFRADNEATVRQVLRFLGVNDGGPIEVMEANPTVRVRSPRLHELLRSLYLGRGPAAAVAKAAIKAVTPKRMRRQAQTAVRQRALYAKPHPPDEEVMGALRRRFKSEVVELSAYLDRDLVSLWGYDELV
jgi:hypothetical protein